MIVVSAMITIAEGKGDEYVAEFSKLVETRGLVDGAQAKADDE